LLLLLLLLLLPLLLLLLCSETHPCILTVHLQLNHRKGLHRELSDAELVSVLEYFRKAGVLFVSKKDILARLDADMGAQLDNKVPILVEVESVEGRYVDNQFRDRDEIIKKVVRVLRRFSACSSNVSRFVSGSRRPRAAAAKHAGAAGQPRAQAETVDLAQRGRGQEAAAPRQARCSKTG
jgi:hypothetical protein